MSEAKPDTQQIAHMLGVGSKEACAIAAQMDLPTALAAREAEYKANNRGPVCHALHRRVWALLGW